MAQRKTDRTREYDEVTEDESTASERAARIFGIIFILIGLVLVAVLIGGFIISKLPYRVDPNLPIPTIDSVDEYTNKDGIDIKGAVLPGETVALYVDDERLPDTADTNEDGEFQFDNVNLEDEGDVTFETAVVRGGLFKRRSEFSNEVVTTVDRTSPSPEIALDYSASVDSDKTTITGTAEAFSTIIVKNGDQEYEATADEKGAFTVSDIKLVEGDNEFTIRIRDRAGNEVLAQEKAIIAYAPATTGSVNGDGASTTAQLPESAGELDRAMEILARNRIMAVMALTSIMAFSASSISAYRLAKKRNAA